MLSPTIPILAFNSYFRFTASLCNALAEMIQELCHVKVIVPSFGTVSLGFAPTGEFLASIRSQLHLQLLSEGKLQLDNRSIVIFPQYHRGRLTVFTWAYEGEKETAKQNCPIEFGDVSTGVGSLFQQILWSMNPRLELDYGVLSDTKRHRQSLPAFLSASNEHFVTFLNELGITLAQDCKFESARIVWTQAIEQFPDSLVAIGNIGQSYSDQGRYGEAEDWFTTAIDRSGEGNSGALHYWNRGLARSGLNKWREALADFAVVSQADPNFGLAILNSARCLQKLGYLNDAEKMYRRCASLQNDTSCEFGDKRDVRAVANEELRRLR